MKSSPLVSVVMVNFNRKAFVEEAIESVLQQTTRDLELLIVENGSTDGGEKIVKRCAADPRVLVITLPERLSIPQAANLGVSLAKGQYIARLDSDDVWLPHRLEKQLQWLVQPANRGVGVCGAQSELIGAQGEKIGEKLFPMTHADCVEAFWYRNPFCHSAVIIPRGVIAQMGPYDESFTVVEDLELWMRYAQRFTLCNVPAILVRERFWGQSVRTTAYKAMVDATLRARWIGSRRYGHRMGGRAHLAFAATWCARWCPSKLARLCFYSVVLPWHGGGKLRP